MTTFSHKTETVKLSQAKCWGYNYNMPGQHAFTSNSE